MFDHLAWLINNDDDDDDDEFYLDSKEENDEGINNDSIIMISLMMNYLVGDSIADQEDGDDVSITRQTQISTVWKFVTKSKYVKKKSYLKVQISAVPKYISNQLFGY